MDLRRCAIGGTISEPRRTQIDDMGDAMHLMQKVCLQDQETLSKLHQRYVSRPSIEAFEWKWKNLTHSGPNNKPANVPFLFEKEEMEALEQLFSEPPLWNRVWIIQELALSPRVVLVAGRHVLDWELISNFLGDISFSDAFHVPYRYGFIGKFLDELFGGPQKVEHQRQSLRAAVQHGGSASTFLDVLMRFEANRASDPRDYVYGLLGPIEDDISIQVDYTKTAARVFTDATLSIINSMRNLDIICQTAWMSRSDAAETRSEPRQPVGLAGLSSWVPDLSSLLVYDKHESMLFAQRGIFSPAEPSIETFVVINGSLLELKAIWIGSFPRKVSKTKSDIMSKRFQPGNSQEKHGVNAFWTSELRQWLAEGGLDLASLDNDAVYVQTTEPVRRAIWRTLTMDCTAYPITRVTDEQMPTMDHVFDHILRGQEPEGQSSRASDGGMDFWRMLPSPSQEMFLRNSKFWTFTATDNGLYTMVQGVQAGDILAIVKGAKVPLILRPMDQLGTREVYHFIGTSYVHGFMDGKASEMLEDGLLIETKILLN